MTPQPESALPESAAIEAARSLTSFGLMLDKMERGNLPMSARQYRRAASASAKLIAAHPDHADIRLTCMRSSSLRELLQNELIARAAVKGSMSWLYSLAEIAQKN